MTIKKVLSISVSFLSVLLIFTGASFAEEEVDVPDHLRPGSSSDRSLEFREISVTERTDTSLTIQWETSVRARGRIQFGRTQPENEELRTSHRNKHQVTFDSLTPGTTYRFRVFARQNSGKGIKSQVIETRTTGIPPPRIQQFSIRKRTMNGATLRWRTNLPTRFTLEAGHDTPLEHRVTRDTPTRYHQVKLERFYPDQPLYYRVSIADSRANSRDFELDSFRTREANYALGKPVTGTFDEPIYGYESLDTGTTSWNQRITDGQFSYSKGTANSGDPSDTTQVFTVNLGEFIQPGRAVFYWRDLAFPRNYEIYGSQTGRYWTKLRSQLDAKNGTHTLTPTGNTKVMKHDVSIPDTVPDYQWIRIEIPEGANYYSKYDQYNFVQLHEFKLFPKTIPEPSDTKPNTPIKDARTEIGIRNHTPGVISKSLQ